METRAGYLIVGTFVLLSIAGILGFFLWIAKTDFDVKSNLYTIYFPGSVTGLTIGGAVNYLGVPVGNVKRINLDSGNLERVNITVSIKNTVPIKEDAYASLEMQGLTGYKFVQIYGGSKNSPLLKVKSGQRYPVIPSRYSGVDEIMTTLPRLANKLTNLVDRINATFNEENRHRFSNTLKNVEALSHNLVESSDPLKNLLNNANLAMITFDKELKNLSHSTEQTLTSVNSAASDIGKFLKDNTEAFDTFTQTGSYEILQTISETREMVTTAKRFFEKLDENPRSLLFDSQRKGISVPPQ
ncbi:MAG TPA: MlaD family protein [Alphaproteobacteria bacterium]|nr:MlaD family protein [Alphaproteobacteria bacterium]